MSYLAPMRALVSSCAAVVGSTILLTGCFTTSADFRSDAESYLVENERLRSAIFADSDTTFTTATCEDPKNRDKGTRFSCSANDSTGATWGFEMVITGSSTYEASVSRRPDGA